VPHGTGVPDHLAGQVKPGFFDALVERCRHDAYRHGRPPVLVFYDKVRGCYV